MKKTLLSFFAVGAFVLGLNAQASSYPNGSTVADFTVTDVHGQPHNLSTIAASGKWILLDFFFTTCPPCISTVPYYSELHQKYGCNAGDLYCLSIDQGDTQAEVLAFEAQYATVGGFAPAPAVSGTEGGGDAVVTAFGVGAFPTYCLIGPDMKMKNQDIWPVSSMAAFETALTNAGLNATVMNCSLGLEENALVQSLELYPNPAENIATIALNVISKEEITITVFNMVGAVVKTQMYKAESGQNILDLNVSELKNGQYIVQVGFENGSTVQRNLNVLK